MPTRQAGRLAKKTATWSRRSCLRTTTCPRSSTPCTWNTFFAKSKPIVVTFMWTPLSVQVVDDTSTLAHRCRCGWGRPSHCYGAPLEWQRSTNSVEILLEGTGTLAMLKATRLSEGNGDDGTEAQRTEAAVLLI